MKRSVVTYNGCFVDTSNGSMNIQTGVFNTTVSGIYQISFTAKYVASNQGKYGAWSDIYINDKVKNLVVILFINYVQYTLYKNINYYHHSLCINFQTFVSYRLLWTLSENIMAQMLWAKAKPPPTLLWYSIY